MPAAEQLVATPTAVEIERPGRPRPVAADPPCRRRQAVQHAGRPRSSQEWVFLPTSRRRDPQAGVLRLGGDGRRCTGRRRAGEVRLRRARRGATLSLGARRAELYRAAALPPEPAPTIASNCTAFAPGWSAPQLPRAEVVSGFDLARREPKPAQRVAPTGGLNWLDEIEATPEQLRKLAETGLSGRPCP